MTTVRTTPLLLMVSLAISTAYAETYYVNAATGDDSLDGRCRERTDDICGPKRTIRAAIEASADGDAVRVADGRYTGEENREIAFDGKSIRLVSENGPAQCIIDCQQLGRAFRFQDSDEGPDAVIDGFMITNGRWQGSPGGAIYLSSSSPTIRNCWLLWNTGSTGGAIYAVDSNTRIRNCWFERNAVTGATSPGGAIRTSGGAMVIEQCYFLSNSAYDGGGVYVSGNSTDVLISNCTFRDNSAFRGGGISYSFSGTEAALTVRDSVLLHNDGRAEGGALYGQSDGAIVVNTVIAANTSDRGAGVFVNTAAAGPSLLHCTLYNNVATEEGGALYVFLGTPTLTNTILWDNTPEEVVIRSGGAEITWCDITGGWPDFGNINMDPQFALIEDFRLLPGSPCIDAGTDDPPDTMPSEDAEGLSRLLDGDGDGTALPDMGAYEFVRGVPRIAASAESLEFVSHVDSPEPPAQVISIRNCGAGRSSWRTLVTCQWVRVTPSTGESEGDVNEVEVRADPTGLPPGTYSCNLAIVDTHSANRSRVIPVRLRVGTTIRVPNDYTTIQSAIDAARTGDLIMVADGTYSGLGNSRLDYRGKAITLRSENGPDDCTIDCANDGRAVSFVSGEGPQAVLEGFTIVNGDAGFSSGGAILCRGSSPTIRNCRVLNCEAGSGGAIRFEAGSDAEIVDCFIANNRSMSQRGGGIHCIDSSPVIQRCVIAYNTARDGGGIALEGAIAPRILDCRIEGNDASFGGGIYCRYANCKPRVLRCEFIGNTATYGGGGAHARTDAVPRFLESVFVGNEADDGGGLHANDDADVRLINSTLVSNVAAVGGGVHVDTCDITIINSILWDNDATAGGRQLRVGSAAHASVDFSCFEGGRPAVSVSGNGSIDWGADNISSDPGFAFDEDYRLTPGSPCIDTGTNDPPGGLTGTDFDGNARPLDGNGDETAIADMGAFEFNVGTPSIALSTRAIAMTGYKGEYQPDPEVLLIRNAGGGVLNWQVDADCDWITVTPSSGQTQGTVQLMIVQADITDLAHGEHECTLTVSAPGAVNSPQAVKIDLRVNATLGVPDEFATIQSAIDAALSGDVVELADGLYTGPGNTRLEVEYKSITVRSANGPHSCILDCAFDGWGITFSGWDDSSTLEGITIRNAGSRAVGLGNSSTVRNCRLLNGLGGGISCGAGSRETLIVDCEIRGNTAGSDGGGIYVANSDTMPRIERCLIVDNTAPGRGGGIGSLQNSSESLVVVDCLIINNSAAEGGGLYQSWRPYTVIANCVVRDNVAVEGGGMYIEGGNVQVWNCIIDGNTAALNGGGMYFRQFDQNVPAIQNCTVVANYAIDTGGALCVRNALGEVCVSNCILRLNGAAMGSELAVEAGATLTVSYSNVEGGLAATYTDSNSTLNWAASNSDLDPRLSRPFDGDYHLLPDSPCIDAGSNDHVPRDVLDLDADGDHDEPIPTDFQNRRRIVNGVVDIGAYEFQFRQLAPSPR